MRRIAARSFRSIRAGKDVSSRRIANVIAKNLDVLADSVVETVPEPIMLRRGYLPIRQAWRTIHRPPTPELAAEAREALIYAEFFGLALGEARRSAERDRHRDAPIVDSSARTLDAFA